MKNLKTKRIYRSFNPFLNGAFWLLIFCIIIFTLTIRGLPGNPSSTELNQKMWRDDGPLELSPERGRFALLYSIIEDNSFKYSLPVARLALPDLVTINGTYVTLFPPGVSFIVIPGYLAGKFFGISQVGTFAVISLFAIFNIFLIRAIAVKIGINRISSTIGAILFAFATPAFAYGVDLYQHHISTFLILISIYSLLRFKGAIAFMIVMLSSGVSIVVDYPNFIMMLPVFIYSILKLFEPQKLVRSLVIKIKPLKFLGFLTFFIPILFFLWFNQQAYGNPFVLSAALPRVTEIDQSGNPVNLIKANNLSAAINNATKNQIGIFTTFNPRLMLNGLFILLISPDRGIIVFTPIMVIGFIGSFIALRKKLRFAVLLSFVVFINITIYSMWGDPWGGWAFGARYIIPTYAILSIFVAYMLSLYNKKNWFFIIIYILISYSVLVNTLGALTSNMNPPKVEATFYSKQLNQEIKYSVDRNIEYLSKKGSKSFVFILINKYHISPWDYYTFISISIILISGCLLIYNRKIYLKEKLYAN